MKALVTGEGERCPRCGKKMVRKEHKPEWRPKASQPYYFKWWDVCRNRKCRHHVQHYEAAKVWVARDGEDGDPLLAEFRAILS